MNTIFLEDATSKSLDSRMHLACPKDLHTVRFKQFHKTYDSLVI